MRASLRTELLLRIMIASVVIGIGIAASEGVKNYTRETSENQLLLIARNSAWYTSGWLEERIKKLEGLLKDPRVQQTIINRQEGVANRALYEFSYLNKIPNTYLITLQEGNIRWHKTAGAENLSERVTLLMRKAQEKNRAEFATPIQVRDKPYILFARAVSDELGKIQGYAAYALPSRKALVSFEKPNDSSLKSFDLVMVNNIMEGSAQALFGANRISQQIIRLQRRESELPLFEQHTPPLSGRYKLSEQEEAIIAVARVDTYPDWRTAGIMTMDEVYARNGVLIWAARISSLIIALAILAVPTGRGAYGQFLQKSYGISDKKKVESPNKKDKPASAAKQDKPKPIAETSAPRTRKEDKVKIQKRKDGEVNELYIAHMIQTAAKQNRIQLLYQPIFKTGSKQPVMYEVYMRIVDEEGEVMPPATLFPVAEKMNLLSVIDEGVIKTVTENHFGPFGKRPPATLSINLSGDTFDSIAYLDALAGWLTGGNIKRGSIMFELRSREIIKDPKAMNFIRKCRDMGCAFAIDYFGGGARALEVAKTLKFDFIKVDAFQFKEWRTDKEKLKELMILAKTAQKLGLPLIMEKVEDQAFASLCHKLSIPFVQGYFFAEPKNDFYTPAPEINTQA